MFLFTVWQHKSGEKQSCCDTHVITIVELGGVVGFL